MYTPFARRAVLLIRLRLKTLIVTCVTLTMVQLPILIDGEPGAIAQSIVTTYSLLCLALPLIFLGGVVAEDFRRGTARLWLQKPIDPVVYYLGRFVEALSVALVLMLLALGGTWLGTAALGDELVPIGDLLDALPRTLIIAPIAFGFSAWLPRGSTIGAIGFVIAGSIAGESLPDLLGRPWNWLADAVFIPMAALQDFRAFVLGTSNVIWIPLARIVAYSVGWTAFGALGVWYTVTKSKLPYAEQS